MARSTLVTRVMQRDPAAVTRRLGGDTLILPVRHKVADLTAIYTLNETGSFLWEQLDGTRTIADLVDAMVAHFDVARDEAHSGLVELLGDLEDEGLIKEQAR